MTESFRIGSVGKDVREEARRRPVMLNGQMMRLVRTNRARCSVGEEIGPTNIRCAYFDRRDEACGGRVYECPANEVWLTEKDFVRHLANQLVSS